MTPIESLAAGPDGAAASALASTKAQVMLAHPVLAVAVTEGGRIRATNAAWQALFKLPSDVSIESHVATLFANVYGADRFERLIQAQLAAADDATAGGTTAEHTLVRRDSSSFLAEVVVWLLDEAAVDRPLAANAIWQVRDITADRELKRELRDLEDYHRELARLQWDVTFVIDRKGRISYASPSIEDALGYRANDVLGEPITRLLAPANASAAGQWLRRATTARRGDAKSEADDAQAVTMLDASGNEHVLACRARDCFDVPRIAGMVIHCREAVVATNGATAAATVEPTAPATGDGSGGGALRARLLELAAAPARPVDERIGELVGAARDALDATVAGYVACGHDAAPTAEPILAPTGASWPHGFVPSADAGLRVVADAAAEPALDADLRAALDGVGLAAAIDVPVRAGGATCGRFVVGVAAPRRFDDAELDFAVGIAQSIAAALAMPAPVAAPDPTDALTGLPERDAARAWLERRVAELGPKSTLTLLSIDLDRLQDVNDRHGHAGGDAVIARSARALTEVFGAGGYVARVSGDAFVVVLANASAKAIDRTLAMLLERIHGATADDGAPHIQASIGVARLPDDATDAATLWQNADMAMREAKRRGRGQAFAFEQRLAVKASADRALDVEIADALARSEFVLAYQPQIALATGKVVGLEALIRWQHPTRGLLLPKMFIDAAVERGLSEAITKSAVARVCEQIVAWRRESAFPELPVGVNVAGDQFHDRRLPALVASALMRSGLPARLLVLELTEQTLVDDDAATERVVKELDRLGVRTAVGGFALGHGALRQLRQLRVAQIKLDRGFVDGLPDDEPSIVVVRTVVEIARQLQCQVIAEGVETREQFERLRALGCEAGQGFFFGPPLSPDEIGGFVADNLVKPVR